MDALRIVIVTGIFPPDIGGPATHASDIAEDLRSRGHDVTVLTLTDETGTRARGLVRFSRRWPWPVRLISVAGWLVARRSSYDVVYSTGMHAEAVAGAKMARRPVVVKMVSDLAWERGRRLGLVTQSFDEFQEGGTAPPRVRAMRWSRTLAVRNASAVITPSAHLASVVDGWIGQPGAAEVVPNGVRRPPDEGLTAPEEPVGRLHAVYVGRLVELKRVDMIVEAVMATPGIQLDVIGDGPDWDNLNDQIRGSRISPRVRLHGSVDHAAALRWLHKADVLVTAAIHEGLPHTVIEAIAQGTPVVASPAGGTKEVVIDGVNGIIVDPPTVKGFGRALGRLRDDHEFRAKLAAGARESAQAWSVQSCGDALVSVLRRVTDVDSKPRVVFVGPGTTSWPPSAAMHCKLEVLARHLRPTLVIGGPFGLHRVKGGAHLICLSRVSTGALRAFLHYVVAPAAAVMIAGGRRPAPVVCQSPYEGFGAIALGRLLPGPVRPPVVIEVHGDWRTAARMYGSVLRRPFAALADRIACWSLRRADRVRVVSRYTEDLARQAGYRGLLDRYVAFNDQEAFIRPPVKPLPRRSQVAFVAALERSKGPDILISAWERTVRSEPQASLVLAGDGHLRRQLLDAVEKAGLGGSVTFRGPLSRSAVVSLLDHSSFLVLPSRSEGFGLAALEAMARGRAVVGAAVGGIREIVEHEVTGLLVAPGDPEALAIAMLRLLKDESLTRRLGRQGRTRAEQQDCLAEFENGMARLAEWSAARAVGRR